MDAKRKNRKIEAQASALCTRALSEAAAVIDVMDLGKLQRVAVDAIQSGRTADGAREAVDTWIGANRRDRPALADPNRPGFCLCGHILDRSTDPACRHCIRLAASARGHVHAADTRRRTHDDEHGTREIEICSCGTWRAIQTSPDGTTTISDWAHLESERSS